MATHTASRPGRQTLISVAIVTACGVSALTYSGDALAQTDARNQSRATMIDEILVTAQRRSERIEDVPISINAFDQGALDRFGILSTDQLQFATPGIVNTATSGDGISAIYIRGVGTGYSGPGLEGRAVAYSSGQIDEDYQREYRDFEYYAQRQQGNHDALAERYRDWSQSNHDSVRGALRAAGLQAQQFDREDSALRSIEAQIENAAGTKQLLQAGGSIAAMQVEQLQKLRQLQMAQIQLQASHVGGQVDRQAEDDSAWHRAVAPRDNNPDTQQPI